MLAGEDEDTTQCSSQVSELVGSLAGKDGEQLRVSGCWDEVMLGQLAAAFQWTIVQGGAGMCVQMYTCLESLIDRNLVPLDFLREVVALPLAEKFHRLWTGECDFADVYGQPLTRLVGGLIVLGVFSTDFLTGTSGVVRLYMMKTALRKAGLVQSDYEFFAQTEEVYGHDAGVQESVRTVRELCVSCA
jgi:hypothetical protein